MTDVLEQLAARLVVGRKSDGRAVYGDEAKAELVALCAQPGASVSGLARRCGVNANQVSRWIRESAKRGACVQASSGASPAAFVQVPVPVVRQPAASAASGPSASMRVHVQLPNGVTLELPAVDVQQFGDVVASLGSVRCSVSTKT